RLPYNPLLLVPPQGIYYLHMGEQHTPAAIFVYSQVIHDFAGRLCLDALPVFLPYMGYHSAAGKAPDWYQAVSPVGLLVFGSGTRATELLPLFLAVIADEKISVVFGIGLFQCRIARPLYYALGNCSADGVS